MNDKISQNFFEYLKNISGNFSIAFHLLNENKIFISSNCGSLFYYNDEDIFTFASEKKFILDYLRNSNLIKKKDIDSSKVKKCLQQIVIFDLDQKTLKEIDLTKNFNDPKIKIDYEKKINIKNNLKYESNKIKNLKRCSQCILPETYPFIKFNSNNVCNYCENYETKFLRRRKIISIS